MMMITIYNKTCSASLWLIVLLVGFSLFSMVSVQAQDSKNLTPENVFELPEVNGFIKFSVNGTYTDALLENGMWVFNDLSLNGSRYVGVLKVSAKNCNVTIHYFRSNALYYTVEGVGEQVINLGFNSSRLSHHSEWSVVNQDSVFFAVGKNWQLLYDNSIVVYDIVGTLRVTHYNYGYPVADGPFYVQHYVFILTMVAVFVTVTVASVIKLRRVRRLF